MQPEESYTDQQLFELLKSSDKVAFMEIYRRYQTPLYLFACNLVQQEELAADLVQDIMMSLWEKRTTTSLNASLEGYLFRAIRYRFFDWIDKQKVRQDYISNFQVFLDHSEWQTDNIVAERELLQVIDQQIEQLPLRMKTIFLMNYRDHLTTEQIAEKLNISRKTVQNQINNANTLLRKHLGKLYWLLFML
ncbi:MAG: RNA polymerase sigma-70 factor [Sphingobacterium sp.]|jgi:RNA polymerase sigma-70 factor (ECF subfamily)|uniref:RNA polymerase sigma-70 factor (ECF subfamily) n=1 Tax=Sphingobacterium yanglingense TaxID=1437280 RepID=A0A4R6WKH1_9SPHI|nr:RNA polymerase sigma-70 factor [Sphingobacterium yanglingense]MDR2281850.1 RNA polymerase sigma-70 factor [Sphingobacterium sp.]TDQ79427.1 RNA polymerase sigma-70 factor (ECF subfamily) [Sphingobacterium yanglingense]